MTVAEVLADREAGDVAPGVGLGDTVGGSADDGDELDFPVGGVAADLDVVEGPGSDAGNLVKTIGTSGTAMPDSSAWLR